MNTSRMVRIYEVRELERKRNKNKQCEELRGNLLRIVLVCVQGVLYKTTYFAP